MITFQKKGDLPQPVPGESEQNRFDRIRKLAAEKHRKSTPTARRAATEDGRGQPLRRRAAITASGH